jgi:8-oxo-dGTP pyrophosphatase MutT (NUDIX family)
MNKIRPNALIIIKKNNYVLASKGIDGDKTFYRIMGGGIEFSELSSVTIKREMMEELNAEIINEEFLCSFENIFEFNSKKYHEITFLYKGDFSDKSMYEEETIKRVDNDYEYSEWVSIPEIKKGNIIFYPEEVIKYL